VISGFRKAAKIAKQLFTGIRSILLMVNLLSEFLSPDNLSDDQWGGISRKTEVAIINIEKNVERTWGELPHLG